MGHKVNPIGIRLGIIKDWSAKWYANSKNFADILMADIRARTFLEKELAPAGVSFIRIERPERNAKFTVFVARPGVVIGKKGQFIEKLSEQLSRIIGVPTHISIEEVQKPELDAKLVADSIAQQLERRVMYRRAVKRAISSAMKLGAQGIKVAVSGRLGGAEIARIEWSREGRVPLHTFRADIDYGVSEAKTTYGVIGVKVWIYKGEISTKGVLSQSALELTNQGPAQPGAKPSKQQRRRHKPGARQETSVQKN